MSDPHADTIREVVARLQSARIARDLSQVTLAEAAGVSRACVQHMEKGRTTPTLLSLLKITDALDIDLPQVLRASLTSRSRKPSPKQTKPNKPN